MKKYETPTMEIVNMLTESAVLSGSSINEDTGLNLELKDFGEETAW